MENDIQKNERKLFIINVFDKIKSKEIDFYFNQKFSTWIFRESDAKELLSDNGHFIYDKEGKLIECSYCGTKEGLELTEKDFIDKELMLLDKVKYELLDLKNRKQFAFYKEYLNKRNSGTILKGDYPQPFTSRYAYELFLKLIERFGNAKRGNQANYSCVYFWMVKDRLIDNDEGKQISFLRRLEEKNIDIKKIKQLKEIGSVDVKKDKYEGIKEKMKIGD